MCFFQAALAQSREKLADELSRLQRDNESLQGKRRLHSELLQQDGFAMPDDAQVRGQLEISVYSFTPATDFPLRTFEFMKHAQTIQSNPVEFDFPYETFHSLCVWKREFTAYS